MIPNTQKTYIGTYKVTKLFAKSRRREILRRGLTIDEAKAVVNRYPSKSTSMVVFEKQFYADKYFVDTPKINLAVSI